MKKITTLLISGLISLCINHAIASSIDIDELTNEFISLIDKKDKSVVSNHFNIDQSSFEAMRENGMILLSNRDYISYLFKEMDKRGLLEEVYKGPKNRIEKITKFSGAINNSLVSSGIIRLNTKDIRDLYIYKNKFYESISDSEYNCLISDYCSAKEKRKVSTHQFTCLTHSEIKNFFRIQRQAILSEINGYPRKRLLNSRERYKAGEIIGNVLVKRLQDIPPSERRIIINEMNSGPDGKFMSRTLVSYMIECADTLKNTEADLIWLTFALEGI